MGNTYGNVTLRGVDVGRVAEVLDDFERSAYLLPDGDRVAVFMEEADEDPLDAAGNLSVALGCTALGVFVFDSDLLVTWLVVNGEITDRYVSDARLVAELEAPDRDADEAGDDDADDAPDGLRTVVYFVRARRLWPQCRGLAGGLPRGPSRRPGSGRTVGAPAVLGRHLLHDGASRTTRTTSRGGCRRSSRRP